MRPDSHAHYDLGLLYEEKGDARRAIEEYQKEVVIHPDAFRAHFNGGILLGKLDRPRDAVAAFKEFIRSNQKFARGYLFLTKAHLNLNGNSNEAIGLAQQGLRRDARSPRAGYRGRRRP